MFKKILLLAAISLCLPVHAELSDDGLLLDRIVAVVNDGVVLQSEFEAQLQSIRRGLNAQGVALPPEDLLRAQVLENLVLKRIQLQRADRLGLTVSDEDVNRALATIAERNGIPLSQLPAALALQGIDYNLYRNEARTEMILEQLRMRDVASRVTVSRGEVEQLLANEIGDNNEYEVYHLLIAVDADASESEIAAAEAEAAQLAGRLRNGDDFGPIAVTYSDSPGVLQSRGNLGWRGADELPSIFADQVTGMSKGEVAGPLRSNSGFHVIQLNDLRGTERVMTEQRKGRHILIQPTEVLSEDEARSRLEALRARIINGEDFATLAETESDDAGTARRGGDLGWANPGTFVPEFEAQLANLQPGELSQPFRTQFGWHIVELLDVRQQDTTNDARRNQAAQMIRMRKIEEETQNWLRQLRDEAYVEVRLDDSSNS
ncbi:MAG: peptidylprolyl isomerase [Gammaproteobacteria bacterium]|nr:peptidylprolyl isomerase [Gammaproteobacteria bacterium]NND58785.1 molecular chaperone SurA [Gammaproteobacteria bacterium]